MIQRKQTVYLLLAIVCFVVNAAMPIGYLIPDGMGVSSEINSLGVLDGNTGELTYPFMALPIVMLALNILHSISTIFMYKNRKAQMTNCYAQVVGIFVEYIVCGFLIWYNCVDGKDVHYDTAFAICLPIVAIILILLAHKGINDDERLVRAADRIR